MKQRILLILLLVAAGCASPIGVTRVQTRSSYREVPAGAGASQVPSSDTQAVLRRYNALELNRRDPRAAVNRFVRIASENPSPDVLLALSEISHLAAQESRQYTWTRVDGKMHPGFDVARTYNYLSATAAYFYLFPSAGEPVNPNDGREQLARSLYNHALADALKMPGSDRVQFPAGALELSLTKLQFNVIRPAFPWSEQQCHDFVASDEYIVRGLGRRVREPGLGVPLIGIPDRAAFKPWPSYYGKGLKLPATAFLRAQDSLADITNGALKVTIEIHCPYDGTDVTVGGHSVPLEVDLTTPLAYTLEGAAMWGTEFGQFFSGQQMIRTAVYLPQPYMPGKIPVVFVHGTTSSPGRWADMYNGLLADQSIRTHYQFWYFIYNSGQPVIYSAMLLRESLTQLVHQLDPEGRDPNLEKMVLIGHSQGGLLSRLAVVESGSRLWSNVTDKSFSDLKFPPKTQSIVERSFFFEPSPAVDRVIFICTPHRGSFLVRSFVQKLTDWLVDLPGDVRQVGRDIFSGSEGSLPRELRKGIPTAVSNMKPGSPFLKVVNEMPFGKKVKLNSIIAILPGMTVPTGNDGVVTYESAHLDGVQSEFIVQDRHSCQGNPLTIDEVRRILTENLAEK